MSVLPPIRTAVVAIIRDRRLLMVTARGRDVYYMPGGKIDPGETAAEAAVREAREEVGVELAVDDLELLFSVSVQAHGEPEGRLVEMDVFGVSPAASAPLVPVASAEVDAVHWTTSADIPRCPPAGAEILRRFAASRAIT